MIDLPMKILIVKLSSIGDILHTLPALAAMRRALPDAEISWVVEKNAAEILRGNRELKNLIEVDTRSKRGGKIIEKILLEAGMQIKNLRVSDYDVALDFQGLLKSATIAKLSKAAHRFGFAKESLREPASRFLLTETFAVEPDTHIVVKNLQLAEKSLNIEIPTDNFEFPIFTDETHQRGAAAIAEKAGGKFAILNPAGGWATKLWDAEKFGQLADKLWEENNLISVVATAPNETNLAQKVLQNTKSGKVLLAQPSLKGFYELAKRAAIYIGGDTGPTFLAVAAKTPIVGIFGPTDWQRNGSPNADDICVERTDIHCRTNCHRRTCDDWICLDIPTATVLRAAQKRLELAAKL